jgi:hypothetical protein
VKPSISGAAGEFGHQHDVQAGDGLDAGDARQVRHLDDLSAQVDHAQHVPRRAGD